MTDIWQAVVRCFFAKDKTRGYQIITVSRDGALFKWAAHNSSTKSPQWTLFSKFYFNQINAELTAADLLHRESMYIGFICRSGVLITAIVSILSQVGQKVEV